jgi:hypothetical protein
MRCCRASLAKLREWGTDAAIIVAACVIALVGRHAAGTVGAAG